MFRLVRISLSQLTIANQSSVARVGALTARSISSSRSALQPSAAPVAAAVKPVAPATAKTVKGATGAGKGGQASKNAAAKAKLVKAKATAAAKVKAAKAIEVKKKAKRAVAQTKQKALAVKRATKADLEVKKPRSTLKPPRVPSNTWQIYLADFVAQQKALLPEGAKLPPVVDLTKVASPLYHALDSQAREVLNRRHAAEKDAYPPIYATWLASLSPDMIKQENLVRFRRRKLGIAHKRNLRLDGEPKRPTSAYFRFCTAIRAGEIESGLLGSETNVLQQATIMANKWRSLSDQDRAVYNEAAAKDRSRYVAEKKTFDDANATASSPSSA